MDVTAEKTIAAKKQIRATTGVVIGAAVAFLAITALLVFSPAPGSIDARNNTVILGILAIVMGGIKEISGIRERQIRLLADDLSSDPSADGVEDLRRSERLAGDVSDAGSLYLWIFGIGAIFSTWSVLF
jgi:hypothetical protein